MKKIKIITGIVAVVAIAGFNVSINKPGNGPSTFSIANIEVLAYGEGVEDCPITEYTRNAREQYVTTTVEYNVEIGIHASYNGQTISLSASASVGGTVGIPDCVDSNDNCCKKSFIENSPKYY